MRSSPFAVVMWLDDQNVFHSLVGHHRAPSGRPFGTPTSPLQGGGTVGLRSAGWGFLPRTPPPAPPASPRSRAAGGGAAAGGGGGGRAGGRGGGGRRGRAGGRRGGGGRTGRPTARRGPGAAPCGGAPQRRGAPGSPPPAPPTPS